MHNKLNVWKGKKNDMKTIVNAANFMWVMLTWLALYFRFYGRKIAINSHSSKWTGNTLFRRSIARYKCKFSFFFFVNCRQHKKEPTKNERETCVTWKQAFKNCTFRFVCSIETHRSCFNIALFADRPILFFHSNCEIVPVFHWLISLKKIDKVLAHKEEAHTNLYIHIFAFASSK